MPRNLVIKSGDSTRGYEKTNPTEEGPLTVQQTIPKIILCHRRKKLKQLKITEVLPTAPNKTDTT